jgi:hypothetical protein
MSNREAHEKAGATRKGRTEILRTGIRAKFTAGRSCGSVVREHASSPGQASHTSETTIKRIYRDAKRDPGAHARSVRRGYSSTTVPCVVEGSKQEPGGAIR